MFNVDCQLLKNFLFFCLLSVFAGCGQKHVSYEKNSNLTQGSVQMNLMIGKTTKAEVLEHFGSPNVTTRDSSGREVWTYQRSSETSRVSSRGSGFFLILFGGSQESSGFQSQSRMITLIIKFDQKDIVYDFRSRTSHF